MVEEGEAQVYKSYPVKTQREMSGLQTVSKTLHFFLRVTFSKMLILKASAPFIQMELVKEMITQLITIIALFCLIYLLVHFK